MKQFLFLDRDGVINKKREDYVKTIQELEFIPGIFDAIKKLNSLGIHIIVITNQSVVNRKIISEVQLNKIHDFMLETMKDKSCIISKIYFCPHQPEERCECRKPNTGMIEQAIKEFNINLSNTLLIGDSNSDIEAAKKMKIRSIKLKTNGSLYEIIDEIKGIFFN